MDKIPMTSAGYSALENELKHRQQVERPRIIQQITDARTHGDLSENAEYHAAKERQGMVEARIKELEDRLSRADVIDPTKLTGTRIAFGATVTVLETETDKELTYQIVGADESDVDRNRISVTSPIARALLGKEPGDEVSVRTPGGKRELEVVKVVFC